MMDRTPTQIILVFNWLDPRAHPLGDTWLLTIFTILLAIGLPRVAGGLEIDFAVCALGLLALAVIRNNRIRGTAAMGIVGENAREALIEGNELTGLSSYAIMLRGSAGAMVRANRVAGCASGMAFVLGDPGHPSTAMGNTIADPKLDGIDVIGDSPILKDNQVLRPHALALRVTDYAQAGAPSVRAQPSLQGNNFRANTIGTVPASEPTTAAVGKP